MHLLQWADWKAGPVWQIPFHDFGMGPIPLSLKLLDFGHTPHQNQNSKKIIQSQHLSSHALQFNSIQFNNFIM